MELRDHLEKLRYFFEVGRLGSMKKASEEVFITQPSLTKSIKTLEDAVGGDLFNRLPRGVELTKRGEMLFQFCHELFAHISDIEQKLEFPDDPMAGVLRVGTYDSIGIYFWPKFLKSFLPQYPRLNLELTTGRSRQIQDKLERGELDLTLVISPKETSQINVEVLNDDSFMFYATTSKAKVYDTPENAPLILMPDAVAGDQSLQEKLNSMGLGERKLYTTSSLESVKELTLNGIGIGLLPQMVAKDALTKKKLKEVKVKGVPKNGIGEHSIGISYHKQRADSLLIKTLVSELKSFKS